FVNESAHGMLIIHRLLELYNQELNKYVDLDNYKLNNISGDDFPDDIFQDPSKLFYQDPPYLLYNTAINELNNLPKDKQQAFNNSTTNIKNILRLLEEKRIKIPKEIAKSDMTQKAELDKIYAMLEECKSIYDQFETERKIIQNLLYTSQDEKNKNLLMTKFGDWHAQMMSILDALRNEDIDLTKSKVAALKEESQVFIKLVNANNPTDASLKDVVANMNKINADLEGFAQDKPIPDAYKLYGRCYYYYNNRLTGSLNRFGEGAIQKMNQFIKNNNSGINKIYFTEAAHYYKVIYPEKKIENIVEVPVSKPTAIPINIENRKIVMKENKKIIADKDIINIELFDHQEIDNDTISLNYNGKWILKKAGINAKPIKMTLPLAKGDNYLILHAENLGIKPPNTCAIRYTDIKGEKQTIILNSDFQHSEYILIRKKE
nr:hypothetical protein [Saprospiraceae bacterium]